MGGETKRTKGTIGPASVVVPPELERALADSERARERFRALSTSHQREYVTWISDAKREQTRERRAVRAVEMLEAEAARAAARSARADD